MSMTKASNTTRSYRTILHNEKLSECCFLDETCRCRESPASGGCGTSRGSAVGATRSLRGWPSKSFQQGPRDTIPSQSHPTLLCDQKHPLLAPSLLGLITEVTDDRWLLLASLPLTRNHPPSPSVHLQSLPLIWCSNFKKVFFAFALTSAFT